MNSMIAVSQLGTFNNNPNTNNVSIAYMSDSYSCVCFISAVRMLIICLLVASFSDFVFAYSCMIFSPPGFVVRIFSMNLNGNKICSQKFFKPNVQLENDNIKTFPIKWNKIQIRLKNAHYSPLLPQS